MTFEIKQDNISPDKKLIRKHWKKIKKLLKKDKNAVSFYIPEIKSKTIADLKNKKTLDIEHEEWKMLAQSMSEHELEQWESWKNK